MSFEKEEQQEPTRLPEFSKDTNRVTTLGTGSDLDSDALRNTLPKYFARKNGNINQKFNASAMNIDNGATGTFLSSDAPAKTITVTNGIITAIA